MHKGQKISGTFTKSIHIVVGGLISKKFFNDCNTEHIKNRLKTLKKNHVAWIWFQSFYTNV
uniref:Uncharacterized protein n=1 Tax=Kalanchoe fedtschenkoi TaxID=63787 RepID=A0A7N0TUQ9_KALFE